MRPPLAPTAVDAGVARAVVRRAIPGASAEPARVDAVVAFVVDRIAGTAVTMRAGVRVVAVALAVATLLTRRVRLDHAPAEVVAAALGPWERVALPGVAEYLRLVRSLVVVGWYDGVGTEGRGPDGGGAA